MLGGMCGVIVLMYGQKAFSIFIIDFYIYDLGL